MILSVEEEALQPLVTSVLAGAYGQAISEAARRETAEMMRLGRLKGDTDSFAARVACNRLYEGAQARVADLEHQEWVKKQLVEEEEEEVYSEDLEEDEFEEEEEEELGGESCMIIICSVLHIDCFYSEDA